jgi:acetyl esterase/lipase
VPTTTTEIHPELRTIARVLPRRIGPRTVKIARRLSTLQERRRPPADVDVVSLGPISVRLHRPRIGIDRPRPAVLWIHGGGFVLGSAAQDDALCRHLVEELDAVVASVDYRLAPEHAFPTPLHDCHDALVWLAGRGDVDADRVAIGGASAGGGLAAGLALLARDRGEVSPVLQLLTYPMLDDRTVLRTDLDESGYRLWDNRSNRMGWEAYLGRPAGSPDVDGLAVPSRHPDLVGVAPAWIGVGTLDLFHDEDLTYAERLKSAGVPCQVEEVDGAFHAFDLQVRAEVVKHFRAAQVRALAEALGVG